MQRLVTSRIAVVASGLVDVLNVRPVVGCLVAPSRNVQRISAAKISLARRQPSAGERKTQPKNHPPPEFRRPSAGKPRDQPSATHSEPTRASASAKALPRPALDIGDAASVCATPAGRPLNRSRNADHARLRDLAHAGELAAMETHFDVMEHTQASYAMAIKAFVRAGQLRRAAEYLERLISSPFKTPSVETVAGVLMVLAQTPDLDGEQRLLELIRRSGFRPDDGAQKRLNDTFRYVEGVPAKERFVELVHAIGAGPNVFLLNMLIGEAAKQADVRRAEYYFAQIAASGQQPTIVTYTSMLGCYKRAGRYEMCFEVEQHMRTQGIEPGPSVLVTLMSVASYLGLSARIGQLLEQSLCRTDDPNQRIINFSAAVSAAARCGDYDGMRRHLALMQQHNVPHTVALARSVALALRHALPEREALLDATPPTDNISDELTAWQRAVFDRAVESVGRT